MEDLITQFNRHLATGQLSALIDLTVQFLQVHPEATEGYGYLSLAHLLLGEEFESQAVWFAALEALDEDKVRVAQQEAASLFREWVNRSPSLPIDVQLLTLLYAWELHQGNLNDIHQILQKAQASHLLSSTLLEKLNILDYLESYPQPPNESDVREIVKLLVSSLKVDNDLEPVIVALVKHLPPIKRGVLLTGQAIRICREKNRDKCAFKLIEIAIDIDPDRLANWFALSVVHDLLQNHDQAIIFANKYLELCKESDKSTVMDLANGVYNIISTLIKASGSHQREVRRYTEEYIEVLQRLADSRDSPYELSKNIGFPTFHLAYFLPYLRDDLAENQLIKGRIAGLTERCVSERYAYVCSQGSNTDKIRLGFLSNCFAKHSVGWLSRWLFHYLDKSRFEIYLYSTLDYSQDSFYRDYFSSHVSKYTPADTVRFDGLIHDDRVQILVDVDSLTLVDSLLPLAFKPAPIQVQWLGWDASGNPGIDYFIADPHVLPDDAQKHYRETLWRLPETYLGVDGFEIGFPSWRRDHLGISSDSIIYVSVQGGMKLNEHLAALQLEIIREVPKSHFIIKSSGNAQSVKELYSDLALELGVSPERLSFPERDPSEIIHRANLQIADIVLDSFPYNGATTTLETLWAGVPLVTKVGQQFASRNSYTFLVNCGIKEGIAYTDEEYVNWGIRYGTDKSLRSQVKTKLFRSRGWSTLWNAEKFTHQMESAFITMWDLYRQAHEGGT